MPTWLILVLAVAAVLLLLAFGGLIATRRRSRGREELLLAQVATVNDALAAAHAADKGWDPVLLHEAARRAFADQHPDRQLEGLTLVQVDDRPGIAQDRAMFRVRSGGEEHDLILGRDGDGWFTVAAPVPGR